MNSHCKLLVVINCGPSSLDEHWAIPLMYATQTLQLISLLNHENSSIRSQSKFLLVLLNDKRILFAPEHCIENH